MAGHFWYFRLTGKFSSAVTPKRKLGNSGLAVEWCNTSGQTSGRAITSTHNVAKLSQFPLIVNGHPSEGCLFLNGPKLIMFVD